ncbi:MAG: hypothetical protein AB8B77_02310 [Alphaproteobacteria bacterium]
MQNIGDVLKLVELVQNKLQEQAQDPLKLPLDINHIEKAITALNDNRVAGGNLERG